MNTCKTCEYWTAEKKAPYGLCAPIDPDTHEPMDIGYKVRICRHPEQTFCETPTSANGFGVADGSTYMAVLATAQDFGCLRHSSLDAVAGQKDEK